MGEIWNSDNDKEIKQLAEREGFESASQDQTKDLTAHGQHYKDIVVIEKQTK